MRGKPIRIRCVIRQPGLLGATVFVTGRASVRIGVYFPGHHLRVSNQAVFLGNPYPVQAGLRYIEQGTCAHGFHPFEYPLRLFIDLGFPFLQCEDVLHPLAELDIAHLLLRALACNPGGGGIDAKGTHRLTPALTARRFEAGALMEPAGMRCTNEQVGKMRNRLEAEDALRFQCRMPFIRYRVPRRCGCGLTISLVRFAIAFSQLLSSPRERVLARASALCRRSHTPAFVRTSHSASSTRFWLGCNFALCAACI